MLTIERLRAVLHYDPLSGVFTWRAKVGTQTIGSVAGTVYQNGRRYIAIDRRRYFAARLAWFYVHGEWPSGQIDHKNVNRLDDRIDNLRVASRSQNIANRPVTKRNRLGVKGVGISTIRVRKPQRYRARIRIDGRLIHLGYFSTPDLASSAYADAARQYFGEFARSA